MDGVLAGLPEYAPGWSGGTRIGASLDNFLEEHGDRLLDPHTVVFVLSDGWDTGEAERLALATESIRGRCRCLIWLNPLLGNESYRPETKGMLAALSHVDLFAPAHNLASLRDLARIVGQLRGNSALPQARRRRRLAIDAAHDDTAVDSANTFDQPERPTTASNLRDLAARQLQRRVDFLERGG